MEITQFLTVLKNRDKLLSLQVAALMLGLFAINLVHVVFPSSMLAIIVSDAFKILILIGGVFNIPTIILRLNYKILLCICGYFLLLILSILFFQENNRYFIENTVVYFSLYVELCVVIIAIRDFAITYNLLNKISSYIGIVNLIFLLCNLFGFVTIVRDLEQGTYNMGFGYACLLPAIILLCSNTKNSSIYNFIYIFGFIVSILLYASRGPLLGILVAFMYFTFRIMFCKHPRNFLLVITALIILIISHQAVIIMLTQILDRLGIYSRTFDLLTNEFTHMSGREIIYMTLINKISEDPLAIRGINAEWHIFGTYAHNILIELYYQFGVILGSTILLVIFTLVFNNLLIKKLEYIELLKLIFLFSSIPALFVSGSLWTNFSFWIWIGLNIKSVNLSKRS